MKSKRGRPKGSKNKPGHKAGGCRRFSFMDRVIRGAYNFLKTPFKQ